MRSSGTLLVVTLSMLLLFGTDAAAQLRGASSAVQGSSSSSSSNATSSPSSGSSSTSGSGGGFGSSGPARGRSAEVVRTGHRGFLPHPYWGGIAGYALLGGGAYLGHEREEVIRASPIRAQLSLDAGWAIPRAARANVYGRLLLPVPLDITLGYTGFVEHSSDDQWLALAIGRLGVDYRIVDLEVIQLRLGLGLRHFQDWVGARFGLDARAGMDIYIGAPWVISVEGGAGAIGEAFLLEVRGSVGVMIESVELMLGYEHLALMPTEFGAETAHLGGPFLGVRVYL